MAEPFLLSAYAWKLTTGNKLTLALSSPWRKRFWVIEERVTKAGPEVFFSYYHDESKSSNVKDAGDTVNVVEIISVGLLTTPRLAVYEGPGSTLPPESKQQLKLYRELICEIQTPGRVYFLRCEDRLELARLAGGLQRLSALAAGEQAIAWPVGHGPEPRPPACVLQARKLAGTLPPHVAQFYATSQGSSVQAPSSRPPTAPAPSTHPVQHSTQAPAQLQAARPAVASKPSPASSIESVGSTGKVRSVGGGGGGGGPAAPLSRSSSQQGMSTGPSSNAGTRPLSGFSGTGASTRLLGQSSSGSLPSLGAAGGASARARETVVIDAEEEERRYDQRIAASSSTTSLTAGAGNRETGAHSRGGSAGSRSALTALSGEVLATSPTAGRGGQGTPSLRGLDGTASAAWKLGALENALQSSVASTQRPVLVAPLHADATAHSTSATRSGKSSAAGTPTAEHAGSGAGTWGVGSGAAGSKLDGSNGQTNIPTPNKQRRPHVEGDGLPLHDGGDSARGGDSERRVGSASTLGPGAGLATGAHSRVSSAGQDSQGKGGGKGPGSRKSVLDDSSSDEDGAVDLRALAQRRVVVDSSAGIRARQGSAAATSGPTGGPSSWMTPPTHGHGHQPVQGALGESDNGEGAESFSVPSVPVPAGTHPAPAPVSHAEAAPLRQDWDDWDREGKEGDSPVKTHPAPSSSLQPVPGPIPDGHRGAREGKEADSPLKVHPKAATVAGPGVQADKDFATASWDE